MKSLCPLRRFGRWQWISAVDRDDRLASRNRHPFLQFFTPGSKDVPSQTGTPGWLGHDFHRDSRSSTRRADVDVGTQSTGTRSRSSWNQFWTMLIWGLTGAPTPCPGGRSSGSARPRAGCPRSDSLPQGRTPRGLRAAARFRIPGHRPELADGRPPPEANRHGQVSCAARARSWRRPGLR